MLVSRSTDGGLTWGKPVTVATGDDDKDWIVCDNHTASPHYGNCYAEYDIPGQGDTVQMRTSTDGGASWGPARQPARRQPRAGRPARRPAQRRCGRSLPGLLPRGTVDPRVPHHQRRRIVGRHHAGVDVQHHTVAGSLRETALPSAAVDAAGTVYVTWADCRFRPRCRSNDIVIAKSTSETTWAAPVRVPIDATSSTADHFIPGLAVDAAPPAPPPASA